MSSTSPMNPTPFFGSKISLISKSEIRYEGILYTVDPKESTIALAQVRSFGSEDRLVENPVPPRTDIFQYIIFRASDIKDLIVDHPPTSTLTDPAIIQAHSTTGNSSFPPSFPQPSTNTSSINTAGSSGQPPQSVTPSVQQQLQAAGLQTSAAVTAATLASPKPGQSTSAVSGAQESNKQPANKVQNNQQQTHGSKPQPQVSKPQQLPQRNQMNRQQIPAQNQQNRQDGNTGGVGGFNRNNFQKRPTFNQNTRGNNVSSGGGFQQRNGGTSNFNRNFNRFHQQRPTGTGGGSGGGGFYSYNRRQQNRNFVNRPNHHNTHPKPTISLPETEFDFEKAQDEFKQLEEKMAGLKVANGDAGTSSDGDSTAANATTTNNADDKQKTLTTTIEVANEPCYDKKSSFFDKISCESLERERGNVQRVDWKAERKLNRETFGVVAPMRRNNGFRPSNRYGTGGYRGYQTSYRSRSGQRTSSQSGGSTSVKTQANGVSSSATATVSSSTPGPSTTTAASVVAAAANLVSPAKN